MERNREEEQKFMYGQQIYPFIEQFKCALCDGDSDKSNLQWLWTSPCLSIKFPDYILIAHCSQLIEFRAKDRVLFAPETFRCAVSRGKWWQTLEIHLDGCHPSNNPNEMLMELSAEERWIAVDVLQCSMFGIYNEIDIKFCSFDGLRDLFIFLSLEILSCWMRREGIDADANDSSLVADCFSHQSGM